MEYRTCDKCGRTFPLVRKYFIRHTAGGNGEYFTNTCKECEIQQKYEREWQDGKLKCHCCGKFLDVSYFGKKKNKYRDNHDSRCRMCRTKQNKTRKDLYDRDTKLNKILQMRYLCAKERATKYDIPFDITKDYVYELWQKQNGKCAISGIDMTFEFNKGRIATNVSIDQINPKKGYTTDNIQLVCMAVNQMKSDFDTDTLLMFCENILQNAAKWRRK